MATFARSGQAVRTTPGIAVVLRLLMEDMPEE